MYSQLKHIHFIGIGGIGMSALARYFLAAGKGVSGYDKVRSEITDALQYEGAHVYFEERAEFVQTLTDKYDENELLLVYTPAIPTNHAELDLLHSRNRIIKKRAEVLGIITSEAKTLAVAGTHGKTTTTTLLAHLLKSAEKNVSAFLGGISNNYGTNLLLGNPLSENNEHFVVVEADEYDRSFLHLKPHISIVTATEPDHLDIYGTEQEMLNAYTDYVNKISGEGAVVYNLDATQLNLSNAGCKPISYSIRNNANAIAQQIQVINGLYVFDYKFDDIQYNQLKLGLPGRHNVENAVAAITAATMVGLTETEIRIGLESFTGVGRRFQKQLQSDKLVVIDDYAHHPTEVQACLNSVKELYVGKKITAVFQPHLFSRTKDFYKEFASALSIADQVMLLDIYPARELPIPGVSSSMILEHITSEQKQLIDANSITSELLKNHGDVIVFMGAGNIELLIKPFCNAWLQKEKEVLS